MSIIQSLSFLFSHGFASSSLLLYLHYDHSFYSYLLFLIFSLSYFIHWFAFLREINGPFINFVALSDTFNLGDLLWEGVFQI